jgi:galactokinase
MSIVGQQQHVDVRRQVEQAYEARFGAPPAFLVRAPGRVNLIGEHTDYNDGFVLPAAIDREFWIALRPAPGDRVRAHSLEFGEAEFSLDELTPGEEGWVEYIRGVAWVLISAGHHLKGWEGVLGGNVPIGAGLSSSAAVEMAVMRAFGAVAGLPWDGREAALLGRRVENEWIGVNSGIMDQMAVAMGRAGHALLIDCRSLDARAVALPPGLALVVLDTGTRRGLVDSAYNERRRQCEAAAARFGVDALRDVDRPMLESAADLDPLVLRRARHVVTENERTLEAAEALGAGELDRLGRLMDESHASLRDDFEVSTDALDTIVELARNQPGCHGARMTGAGFGGCAVAAVDTSVSEAFAGTVARLYREALGLEPQTYICRAAEGASLIERQRSRK